MSTAPLPTVELQPPEWSGVAGERWARHIDRYETMLAPIGDELLARAELVPGLSLAEIGCGGGGVSRAAAARVGPDGHVLGIDISPTLTTLATERATAAGITNLAFRTADAGSAGAGGESFDRLLSRFGIMFFNDPPAAFANLRRLLKPGGRADFAVWAPPAENRSISAIAQIAGRYLAMPKPEPHAPGPFGLDDPDYFSGILAGAGFSDTRIEKWAGKVKVGGGGSPADAAEFVMTSSALAEMLAEQPETIRQQIRADAERFFADYDTADGVVMPVSVFMVTSHA